VAISVGVIFLFVDSFLEGRREKREAAAKAAAAPSETEGSPEAT